MIKLILKDTNYIIIRFKDFTLILRMNNTFEKIQGNFR